MKQSTAALLPTDLWNARFSVPDYIYGTEPNAFLCGEADRLQPGQRVLAVADGEGRNGVWLAQQGLKVVSLDASRHALDKAARLAQVRGVALEFHEVDLLRWAWPESEFDAVVAIFIQFLCGQERAQVFASMTSALVPGGLFLLQGYTTAQLKYRTGGPSSVDQLYTADMLRDLLGTEMEILLMREHVAELHEGSMHCGAGALIDLVARRR